MDDDRPAWIQLLDDGAVMRRYIGPADFLCRVMAGDVLTQRDFVTDRSPFVSTLIHDGIARRARWMAAHDG